VELSPLNVEESAELAAAETKLRDAYTAMTERQALTAPHPPPAPVLPSAAHRMTHPEGKH
jgi:hypothetical protein